MTEGMSENPPPSDRPAGSAPPNPTPDPGPAAGPPTDPLVTDPPVGQPPPAPAPGGGPPPIVRYFRRTRSLVGKYTRKVRWLPPLVLGLILGALTLGSAQCIVEDRVGFVESPSPEPATDYDITLIITNGYIERQITQSLERSNVFGTDRIDNIQVRTRNNRVVVTGVLAIVVRPRIEAQLSLRLEDGSIKLKVEETRGPFAGQLGNLPRLIEPVINDRVERATSGFQADLVSVNAPDQGVTVTASLRQPLSPTPGPSPAPTSQPCICITATPTPAR